MKQYLQPIFTLNLKKWVILRLDLYSLYAAIGYLFVTLHNYFGCNSLFVF